MREGVTVTHIMADGTECKDLSKYFDTHEPPPELIRVLVQMMYGKKPTDSIPLHADHADK